MNKLPHSWAVFNDGSEEFQIVYNYLKEKVKKKKKFIDKWFFFYYGIDKQGQVAIYGGKDDFDTILTLKQFKDSIQ